MRASRLQIPVALLLAGLWGLAVYVAHGQGHLGFLDRVESTITDVRTLVRGTRVPPEWVTIVAIDDALVKKGGSYPLPRADLARIVDAIAGLAPKVLAIDLLLVDRGAEEGDEALAKSLAAPPAVIGAAAVFPEASQSVAAENEGPLARLPRAERFLLPLGKFAAHADIGIVNVATDRGGAPRAIPMLFRTSDRIEMSFPLRIAALAIGKEPAIEPDRVVLGERVVPTDIDHALPLSFYGPRRTIPTLSAALALSGELAADSIRDHIVIVGATVTGGGDFFPTPFDSVMPGVEVIATAVTHLMAGDGIVRNRAVRIFDGVVAVVLPMILVALLAWRRSAAGLIAAAAVVALWTAANFFAFTRGIWFSAAVPIAAAAPPAILFAAVQLWSGRRRAQYFAMRSELLEQFQPPGIQQWLSRDPNFLEEPVRQNAAVVFIDLSGFTSLSERVGAEAIRELLKKFHALVDREAVAAGGMITSFLGDGAMILFGLPEAASDDAFRAAECAVGLCVSAEEWLTSLDASVASRLGFKVGAHFGELVASRLGGGSYQHITATGDTVNVASRLMEVAAQRQAALAVSNELLRSAGRDCALYKSGILTGPRENRIRGRSAAITVWLWRSDLAAQGGEGLSPW